VGSGYPEADLPGQVQALIAYRNADTTEAQTLIASDFSMTVRWDLLVDAAKGPLVWKAIARQMGPQALRMNLNTLLRHEVLTDREIVDYVAGRPADADDIRERLDPESVGAAGEVRCWRNELLAAVARGQHKVQQSSVCWLLTG
jgi:hypothetical protein